MGDAVAECAGPELFGQEAPNKERMALPLPGLLSVGPPDCALLDSLERRHSSAERLDDLALLVRQRSCSEGGKLAVPTRDFGGAQRSLVSSD